MTDVDAVRHECQWEVMLFERADVEVSTGWCRRGQPAPVGSALELLAKEYIHAHM